jgi:glutamate-5-semialdehyde dehydrogenase
MKALAQAAKRASRALAVASTQTKDLALAEMAVALRAHAPQVLAANALDLAQAKQAGKNAAFLDRLALDPSRVEAMANTLEAVRALEDPVGAVTAN